MKSTRSLRPSKASALILTVCFFVISTSPAIAQNVQHLTITQPGGMPGLPVVTGIERGTNQVTVTWDGPSGYYQLFHKGLADSKWQPVGGPTNLSRRATLPAT